MPKHHSRPAVPIVASQLVLIRGRLLQVRQSIRDDFGLLDGADDRKLPAAASAGLDIDPEDALQALCPGHRDVPRSDRLVSGMIRG